MRSPDLSASVPNLNNAHPPSSKFRFKSHKRLRSPLSPYDNDPYLRKHRKSSHHHHHHHHYRRHRNKQNNDDNDPYAPQGLDPETAFRESLFDALADDEGAAFWEGVYGQPIPPIPISGSSAGKGELEQMDEEEYVNYVRGKMWEKSHGYIIEERRKREEERVKRKQGEEKRERGRVSERSDRGVWDRGFEEGFRRREARRWRSVWEAYVRGWDGLKEAVRKSESDRGGRDEDEAKIVRKLIPWPVESGQFQDVRKEEVEQFLRNAPQRNTSATIERTEEEGSEGERHLLATLKVERIRWHPDKMQQRFGNLGIDEGTMKAVTAVFQVMDQLWSDVKKNVSTSNAKK